MHKHNIINPHQRIQLILNEENNAINNFSRQIKFRVKRRRNFYQTLSVLIIFSNNFSR